MRNVGGAQLVMLCLAVCAVVVPYASTQVRWSTSAQKPVASSTDADKAEGDVGIDTSGSIAEPSLRRQNASVVVASLHRVAVASRGHSDASGSAVNDEDGEADGQNATLQSLRIKVTRADPMNPFRVAEAYEGKFYFMTRPFREDPMRLEPVVSQAPPTPNFNPALTVRRPPRSDPAYVAHASVRPVVRGVYRHPYHEATCSVWIDPCETLKSSHDTLSIADPDLNRPPINLYHCRKESPVPGCAGRNRGHTVMYRHRRPFRWFYGSYEEFAGEVLPYSDVGHPSWFPAATNDPLPPDGEWKFSEVFDDCNASAKISVVVTRVVGSGYGLTNRVISYTGMMALAGRIGRHFAVDKGLQRFRFTSLVNLTSTVFPERLRVVKRCQMHRSVDVRKKLVGKGKRAYQRIDRREVIKRPHRVLHRYDIGFHQLRHFPAVLFHEMYLRYPQEQDQDLGTNAGTLFCGLQFVDWIREAAFLCIRRLRELSWRVSGKVTRKYAALHLRLEKSDSISMLRGRKAPRTDQVLAFIEETIAPQLKERGIEVLVVCSGPLDSAVWSAIKSKGNSIGVQIVSKTEMLPSNISFKDFGTAAFDHDGPVRTQVTSTDAAAADLLVLEKADIVFLTTTSSFSAFVYARRCGGSVHLGASITWNLTRTQLQLPNDAESEAFPGRIFDNYGSGCTLVGNVLLYDVYLDGTFTGVVEYPCGYQFGDYITAPPALVPRPPWTADVVTFRFKPDSVLYKSTSRNNGIDGRRTLKD